MKLRVIANVVFITLLINLVCACTKKPLSNLNGGRKKGGDNGYRLVIGNNPDEGYEAGKTYNCMCVDWQSIKNQSVLLKNSFCPL